MSDNIKTCIYSASTDHEYSLALRNGLIQHPIVRIVTEAHDQRSLTDCLERLPVTLLVVDLDPEAAPALKIMEEISGKFPSLAIIGLAQDPDPELILSAMRCGCRQFITKPIDPADLSRAMKSLTRETSSQAKTDRLICLVGCSGGAGVTTIAANLAIELAQLAAEPCALVDLQLEFGSIATYFDFHPDYTIADLTNTPREIDPQVTEQAMNLLPCNVAVLARPERVEQVAQIDPERIAQILKILTRKFDSVVVDNPCRFDRTGMVALEMATSVLLVLQLTVPSIRNAQRLRKTLLEFGMPEEKIAFVANRFVRNSPLSLEDVEEHLGSGVFAVIPNDYETVQAALNFGRPLVSESPTSPVRKAIAEISQRIYSGEFAAISSKSKAKTRSGFLSRWLGK